MEIKNMSAEELEARKAAIVTEAEAEDADVDALLEEQRAIVDELEARKAAEAKREEIRNAVAAGAGTIIEKPVMEEKKMTNNEVRNSQAYIDAFARYLRTEDARECRSLLTENVSGDLPVPEFVEGIVHTAWERDEILSRVRRVFIRGNLKVAFELSADPAYVHVEGTTAVTEESLTLGIVTLIPASIKKWVSISDEVADMGGEEFIRYIYDELTYRVFKKLADLVIADIVGAPTSSDDDEVGVPAVSAAPSVTAVPTAAAYLSDEATNIVVVMNRLTDVAFLEAQAAGNFAIDPFAGLPRIYTSALPSYATATEGTGVYAIVGDLSGVTVNFPVGDDIVIKWDDMTEMTSDMIRVLGRIYAAHDVTGPGKLAKLVKPSAVTT